MDGLNMVVVDAAQNLRKKVDNNFIYCGKYKPIGNYDCNNHGCYDEGICRCYKIESVKIEKIFVQKIVDKLVYDIFYKDISSMKRDESINQVLNNISPTDLNEFYKYCIDRILTINKAWDISMWEAHWSMGYYGDEIDSISMKKELYDKVKMDLNKITEKIEISDMVQYLLKKEYGSILNKIKNKFYSVEIVNMKHIDFPQTLYHQKVLVEDLSYMDDLETNISGICIKEGDRYKVVDGYHRLTHILKQGKQLVRIITIC